MFPKKDDNGTGGKDVNQRGVQVSKWSKSGGNRDEEDVTANQGGSKDEDIVKVRNVYSVNQTHWWLFEL